MIIRDHKVYTVSWSDKIKSFEELDEARELVDTLRSGNVRDVVIKEHHIVETLTDMKV